MNLTDDIEDENLAAPEENTPQKGIKLRKEVRIALWVGLALAIFVFVQARQSSRTCQKIIINIVQQEDNEFLKEEDIVRLATDNDKEPLIGAAMGDINTKTLEERIRNNVYVRSCQVSKNIQGTVRIIITQRRPIARWIKNDQQHFYVDSMGVMMPIMKNHTARVMAITQEIDKKVPNFQKDTFDIVLLRLLNTIDQDKLLRAQIAHIHINKYEKLTMVPQIGAQIIDFGSLVKFEEKIKKLRIFYKKIIPLKGWKAYKSVSLRYLNQIVCE